MKKLFGLLLVLALVLSFILVATTPAAASTDRHVPGTYPDIQAAINAASAGDTIIVAPGTYIGNITIDRLLTITGAGSGSDPASNTIITPDAPGTSVVTILAGGVSATERLTLSNLRVQGGDSHGIRITAVGSYITFDNVASVGHGNRGVSAEWNDVAHDIRLLNCNFSQNTNIGFRTSSSAQIRGLTITDTHMDENLHGLYLNANVTGLAITGGSFDGNYGPDTHGVGIYSPNLNRHFDEQDRLPNVLTGFTADNNKRGLVLHTRGSVEISGASASNNEQRGIQWYTREGEGLILIRDVNLIDNGWFNLNAFRTSSDPLRLRIENCIITGSSFGVDIYALGAEGEWSDVQISNCTIEGNDVGIRMFAASPANTISGVSILCNSIESNGTGLLINEHVASGNTAVFNDISGNTIGMQNNSASAFDARDNWWGADDGPGPVGPGSGDPVSANVLYEPWINKSIMTATGTGTALFAPSEGNISSLEAILAISPTPRGVTLPHGMFDFEICCIEEGATVVVTVTLPTAVPDGFVWWKHDGTGWYSLPIGRTTHDNVITITLTDGGVGDADGISDGFIRDPGGPGNPVPPLAVGWEGWSVDRAAVMAPWIALFALIAGASVFAVRRRRART